MIRPLQSLVGLVEPGQSVYVAGGLTPPSAWVEALQHDPERSRGLHITTTVAPTFPNPFDVDRLHPSCVLTGPMMRPDLSEAQRQGRYRALPLTFIGFLRHLAEQTFDLGVIQVAPADAHGRWSLGPSVEFLPAALRRCKRVVALVNPLMAPLPFGSWVEADRIEAVCEAPCPLPSYATGTDEATETIGHLVAGLLDDGCTLQTGLGKVPTAIARSLRGHRRITIHSGLISDGLMELALAGALDEDAAHRTTLVAGSAALYDWLPQARGLRIVGVDETHAPQTLARLQRFVAVNSALEVDLFGQCNLEHQGGRAVSGAGGAPDFARAARAIPGGLSVVALNATHSAGTCSRIVATLGPQAMTSLSRLEVDVVVTEFGVADLRRASVHERAAALIGIAAPQFREPLARAWHARASTL
ncbi:acetyl-CoA hydrolase/transferase family protein [Pseudorhodoferax sp.]|uniref:acetyl-CoA hydrolase/transferase family protein n=1 Tax=Pseudorhodoferax sp. TaxID=1993553 RepID=UPI0039E37896